MPVAVQLLSGKAFGVLLEYVIADCAYAGAASAMIAMQQNTAQKYTGMQRANKARTPPLFAFGFKTIKPKYHRNFTKSKSCYGPKWCEIDCK